MGDAHVYHVLIFFSFKNTNWAIYGLWLCSNFGYFLNLLIRAVHYRWLYWGHFFLKGIESFLLQTVYECSTVPPQYLFVFEFAYDFWKLLSNTGVKPLCVKSSKSCPTGKTYCMWRERGYVVCGSHELTTVVDIGCCAWHLQLLLLFTFKLYTHCSKYDNHRQTQCRQMQLIIKLVLLDCDRQCAQELNCDFKLQRDGCDEFCSAFQSLFRWSIRSKF